MPEQPAPVPVRGCVVVGVDGSPTSLQALRWAKFLADTTGSTMQAVIAWQPPAEYGWSGLGWPTDWDPAADAGRVLDEAVRSTFGAEPPAGLERTVHEGNAAQALLDAGHGARQLVVGSRGHGGFAGLLLGSVSAACAEHATCPVLVVHGSTPPPSS